MSFAMGNQQMPHTNTSELCLRFPENVGVHGQISYDQAIGLLAQAVETVQHVPFAWSYIDKPPDGQAYLIFIIPSAPSPIPPDGIRWLDQEKTYRLPVPNGRELEVSEVKFGFVPNAESTASRIRRRFRLTKGGNPQLMLLHYLRGDPISVPAHLLNVPIRAYPLRPNNDPRIYVAGERIGQRVPYAGPPPSLPVGTPAAPPHMIAPTQMRHPPPPQPPQPPPQPPNGVGVGVGVGMGMGLGLGIGGVSQAAATLAHQNQAMEAMERERRSGSMATIPGAARPPEEDDSGDEYENVSTRTLAVERFKRNHELMAEVFDYASKGHRSAPAQPSPYAGLNIDELNDKVAKINADVEALKAKAEERRSAREAARVAELQENTEAISVVAA